MIIMLSKRSASIAAYFAVIMIISSLALQACSVWYQLDKPKKPKIALSGPPDGYGLYESCAPERGAFCRDRLTDMADSGFRLVLNYDQLAGSAKEQLAYAKQADALGMKIIWAMDNPILWDRNKPLTYYADLAAKCYCSDNTSFILYVVSLVKDLPATWGYYIGDGVLPSDHAALKDFSDLVKRADPNHPRLFITSCSQCNQDDTGNQSYVDSLTPMADTADVLGDDWYPVGSESGSVADTSTVATDVQSVAKQSNKQSAMVLQAFNWSQYPHASHACQPYPSCLPYPTVDQMRQMLEDTWRNSCPRLILWYSYFDIQKENNPSQRWQDLVNAVSTASVPPKSSAEAGC